jgi:hypothetical protein
MNRFEKASYKMKKKRLIWYSHVRSNKCSIEKVSKLALTLLFKRQQHRKLSWLDKDSDKDQSQFDELFN